MKEFRDLNGFIAHLTRVQAAVVKAEHTALKLGAEMIEKEAKAEIGTYQNAAGPFPAWDPLSEATLQGFSAPGIGHIPGKEELGYAPPDNPLLREGDMRDSIEHTVEGNTAVVGTNDEVALYQELGTPNARYPIPPRSFLGRAAFVKSEAVAEQAVAHVLWALQGLPGRKD